MPENPTPQNQYETLTVILNPCSGSAGDDFRERVESALQNAGADYEILETTPEIGGKELAREAIKNGARHLVACGGDGTVMSVVNGIGHSRLVDEEKPPQVMLSIVPGGTANLLAGALKIPSDIDEAIATAQEGRDLALDLGTCGSTWFALGLGLGLTERLVSQTSAVEKERLGKLAYAKAMLLEMGMKPHRFSLKLDDEPEQIRAGVGVVVANAGEIGGGFTFAPFARMDDGKLDVCVLRRFYFRDVMRLAWRSVLGTMSDDRAVDFYQARHVEINCNPPLDLQIDGEEVDKMIPLVADVVPHAILVRVPPEKAAEAAFEATGEPPLWRQHLPIIRGVLFIAFLLSLIYGVVFSVRRKRDH
jgi:YegS/Rv2252/BmrU family lipid kinase